MKRYEGWIWLSDETEVWVPGKVVGRSIVDEGEVELENGQVIRVEKGRELRELDEESLGASTFMNMVKLNDLSEGPLLHNLRKRYANDAIYTYVGAILIAINPFQVLPLYSAEILETYVNNSNKDPHCYAIASAAYQALVLSRHDQAICISGESGAGKTESMKLMLQFLAEASSRQGQRQAKIEQQILQTNPVTEAFGNAKTLRNDNSSRFGKWTTLIFVASGRVIGAAIIQYLLEKSRVSFQAEGERNFHAMYQLLAQAHDADADLTFFKETLRLEGESAVCDNYRYLTYSSAREVAHIDDKRDYDDVVSALRALNFEKNEIESVWRLVAFVLFLGNLDFIKGAKDQAVIKETGPLKTTAEIGQVDPEALTEGLIAKNIGTRSIIRTQLSVDQAEDARDAMARSVFARLFDFIFTKINQALSSQEKNNKQLYTIGVLDIFGFEHFEYNSFEQLCINFCNEKLQFFFNDHIFSQEALEYQRENIDMALIQFQNNEATLSLIEDKRTGILAMLDEECIVPRGSDAGYLSKLIKSHDGHHKDFQKCSPKEKRSMTSFHIIHYAADVKYTIVGFLDKNRDRLLDALSATAASSKDPILSKLFLSQANDTKKKKKKNNTLAALFRAQLASLVDALEACQPHFVRCIKPNAQKVPKTFTAPMVQAQMRCAGVLEVCKIRRAGFPYRSLHADFIRRYRILTKSAVVDSPQELLKALDLGSMNAALGKTKVFLRTQAYDKLEVARDEALSQLIVSTQASTRRFLALKRYDVYTSLLKKLGLALSQCDIVACDDILSQLYILPHAGAKVPLVIAAHKFKEETKALQAKLEALRSAMNRRNLQNLQAAIDELASTANGEKSAASLLPKARQLADRLRREPKARDRLAQALSGNDIKEVEASLAEIQELELQGPDVEAAKKKLADLHSMHETLAALKTLVSDQDYDDAEQCSHELTSLLARAAELCISANEPIILSATSLLASLRETLAVLAKIPGAIERAKTSRDKSELEALVARARESEHSRHDYQILHDAEIAIQDFVEEEACLARLKSCTVSATRNETASLSAAISAADRFAQVSPAVSDAYTTARKVLDRFKAESDCLTSLKSNDLDLLAAAVESGETLFVDGEEAVVLSQAKITLAKLKAEQAETERQEKARLAALEKEARISALETEALDVLESKLPDSDLISRFSAILERTTAESATTRTWAVRLAESLRAAEQRVAARRLAADATGLAARNDDDALEELRLANEALRAAGIEDPPEFFMNALKAAEHRHALESDLGTLIEKQQPSEDIVTEVNELLSDPLLQDESSLPSSLVLMIKKAHAVLEKQAHVSSLKKKIREAIHERDSKQLDTLLNEARLEKMSENQDIIMLAESTQTVLSERAALNQSLKLSVDRCTLALDRESVDALATVVQTAESQRSQDEYFSKEVPAFKNAATALSAARALVDALVAMDSAMTERDSEKLSSALNALAAAETLASPEMRAKAEASAASGRRLATRLAAESRIIGQLRAATSAKDKARLSQVIATAYAELGIESAARDEILSAESALESILDAEQLAQRRAEEAEAQKQLHARRNACETALSEAIARSEAWLIDNCGVDVVEASLESTIVEAREFGLNEETSVTLRRGLEALDHVREAVAARALLQSLDTQVETHDALRQLKTAIDRGAKAGLPAAELLSHRSRVKTAETRFDAETQLTQALQSTDARAIGRALVLAHAAGVHNGPLLEDAEAAKSRLEQRRELSIRLEASLASTRTSTQELDLLIAEAVAANMDEALLTKAREARSIVVERRSALHKLKRAVAVATRTRNAEALASAVEVVEDLDITEDDDELVAQAEELLLELHCESEARTKLVTALTEAINSHDGRCLALRSAVAAAKREPGLVDSVELSSAITFIQGRDNATHVQKVLRSAIVARSEERLRSALAAAAGLKNDHFLESTLEEARKCLAELEEIAVAQEKLREDERRSKAATEKRESLTRALGRAVEDGDLGLLERLLDDGLALNMRETSAYTAAETAYSKLRTAERLLATALECLNKNASMEILASAYEAAAVASAETTTHTSSSLDLKRIEAELTRMRAAAKATRALRDTVTARADVNEIESALSALRLAPTCRDTGILRVEDAKELMHDDCTSAARDIVVNDANILLRLTRGPIDEALLEAAAKRRLDGPQLDAARTSYQNKSVKAALDTAENDVVSALRAVVTASRDTTTLDAALGELVSAADILRVARAAAAIKNEIDTSRADRLLTKCEKAAELGARRQQSESGLIHDDSVQAFHWTRFPGLRSESDFLQGLYTHSDKRRAAAQRLSHQNTPIHRSLTKLSSPLNDSAKACYRDILTFCGELYHQFPDSMAHDLISKGRQDRIESGDLSDEIIIQLTKHLTANESILSSTRAWRLLKLCLDTFSPSSDLLPYIRAFTRNATQPAEDDTFSQLLEEEDNALSSVPRLALVALARDVELALSTLPSTVNKMPSAQDIKKAASNEITTLKRRASTRAIQRDRLQKLVQASSQLLELRPDLMSPALETARAQANAVLQSQNDDPQAITSAHEALQQARRLAEAQSTLSYGIKRAHATLRSRVGAKEFQVQDLDTQLQAVLVADVANDLTKEAQALLEQLKRQIEIRHDLEHATASGTDYKAVLDAAKNADQTQLVAYERCLEKYNSAAASSSSWLSSYFS